jgi:TPR repeat protein
MCARDVDCLKREADEGGAKAKYEYTVHLLTGGAGPDRLREAVKYFKLSADQGFAKGQYRYAGCLYEGIGVSVDCVEATGYLKKRRIRR